MMELQKPRRRTALLLCLCGIASSISAVYFVRYLAKPETGLVVNYPEVVVLDGRVIFSPRSPFSPAVASGLLPRRDQIVSVNGAPVSGSRDIVVADGRVRGFSAIPVEVVRDGTEKLTILLAPGFTPARVEWLFVLVLCVALSYTAFTIAWRLPDEPGTLPLVLAALSYLLFSSVKPFYYESVLSNVLIHFGKITAWLLVLFGAVFPIPQGSRTARAALAVSVVSVWVLFSGLRIYLYVQWFESGAEVWLDRFRFLGKIGNISDGLAYVSWGALLARAYLRAQHQREKMQLQWILAGILVALPPYFFFDQLPLIIGRLDARISLGHFAEMFLAFVPVFVLIGLTRHRAFNLRFLMSRYVLYGVLFLLMMGMFGIIYPPLRDSLTLRYNLTSPITDLMAAAVIFIALVPTRSLLVQILERRLFRSRYLKSAGYISELERRNSELMLIVEELGRQNARSLQSRRLTELRVILRGIARRLREPVQRMGACLAEMGDPDARTPGPAGSGPSSALLAAALKDSLQASDFIRSLESLAGPSDTTPARANPGTIARAAIEKIQRQFSSSQLLADIQQCTDIACNQEETVEALSHVLENAAEATQGSMEPVLVRVAEKESRIVVEVIDKGPGIALRAKKRLFTPFFTTKPGHQGLGLYFAKLIVERNDGSIEARSGADGTVFRLSFPAAQGGRE